MKLFKILGATLAAALFLAGCGSGQTLTQPTSTGGGGGGGGGGGPTVASVTVSSSTASIAADGSTTATITAIARDAGNVAVANAAVTFSSSAGLLQNAGTTTDASGMATATLSAAGVASGTAITVSASVGGTVGSTVVNVVSTQQTLSLTTDSPQIASSGATSATISALLRDANNNALPGATVQFQATSGVITVTQATTDANGIAKATLTAGTDPTNRSINVTATTGSVQPATIAVAVIGTTLSLSGPTALVLGNTGSYQVQLKDSAGHGIANRPVTISSANGNGLSAASLNTDANGQAVVVVTATSTANNGNDVLTASALGLIATQALTVSSQNFKITTPSSSPTTVNLNVPQTITATWLNNGAPVTDGTQVSFSSTRGTLSAATMPTVGGVASVTISSTTSGPGVVTASGTGVSAQTTIDFVATTPSQVAVQASPSSVAIQGQSTITATVRDAQNNPVQFQQVNFSLTTDTTGGQLSASTATTDAQGVATTVYTAGGTTSGANGVTISVSVQGTSVTGSVSLTVGGQAVFLSLGTGNTINSPDQATYSITYAVLALDSQGAAVANVPVTLKVLPVSYVKGNRQWDGSTWATVPSTATSDPDAFPPGTQTCANEDTDYTGIFSVAKDYNSNQRLDPGNIAAVSPNSGSTDASGELLVSVTYPKDHAYYVTVQLVAATTVQGTQSSTSSTFQLPGAAADFNTRTTAPPGPVSPYGQGTTCANPL